VQDLQQSTYSVTSVQTESDSFAPSAAAPTTAPPSTSPTTVPVHERVIHAPPVEMAFKPSGHGRSSSNWFPWFMVGAGGIVALALLWAGRRSRQSLSETIEEMT
jgi:hypothetical protein